MKPSRTRSLPTPTEPTDDSWNRIEAFLKKENQDFENHWLWEKWGCRPRDFFQALDKYLDSLPLTKSQCAEEIKRAKGLWVDRSKPRQSSGGLGLLQELNHLQV